MRKNAGGTYLKLSERRGTMRKTVLIPASGIGKLQAVLEEVLTVLGQTKEPTKKAATPAAATSSNVVYVSGLAWTTNEDSLANHFRVVGQVVKSTILRATKRGKVISLGSGLVEFASIADATRAIEVLNDSQLDGRTISCREDRKAGGSTDTEAPLKKKAGKTTRPARVVSETKVFVSSFSADITDEEIVELFSNVGDVEKIEKVGSNPNKNSWVIEFQDAEGASEAIAKLNNKEVEGSKLYVRVYRE